MLKSFAPAAFSPLQAPTSRTTRSTEAGSFPPQSCAHASSTCSVQIRREARANAGVMLEEKRQWAPPSSNRVATTVSCTTFNILAPIYKRLDKEDQSRRESEYRECWLARNCRILDRLLAGRSSIICLQELWVGNEELVQMYEQTLGDAGYATFKLARTGNRGDGLLTALHKDYFSVLNYCELRFNDFGDRVAQLLHAELVSSIWQNNSSKIKQQVLIVNTHLLFPHDFAYCLIRVRQVYTILQYVESYKKENNLGPVPIILCGDWNGSKRGQVYKFIRSQGFVSSYDTANHYRDGEMDAPNWVSHRNHRGNICGVDFIWLLNPNKQCKPLRTSWNEAMFCIIKHLLRKASLTEDTAFKFFNVNDLSGYISYSSFCRTLHQMGLTGHSHGLSTKDMEDLWIQADVDKDGFLGYFDFRKSIWDTKWSEYDLEESLHEENVDNSKNEAGDMAIGLDVRTASLFPPEVEKGTWPENYTLSDHALLTAVFSTRAMACS